MNILAIPTDNDRLANRKAIKDGTTPFRKSNKPRIIDCDLTLPFTVDVDSIERKKLTDNGILK